MSNPLLEMQGLPPFSAIRPEHVEPAIDQVLADNRRAVDEILARGEYSWTGLIEPLERIDDRLGRIWSPVRHMNAVVNSEALRKAYNACLPKLSDYGTELGQREDLHGAYRQLKESPEYAELGEAQRKVIEDALLDFHLNGVDLAPEKKQRLKAIQQRLAELQSRFEEHLLDATHAWEKHVEDAQSLKGLPETARDLLAHNARQKSLDGWLINLEFPSYYAVMTHADDRTLRETVYTAYVTRASELGDKREWDNGPLMGEILALRQEAAGLLGFANYAERSLVRKMARSPQEVLDFLRDLARRARPAAEKELETLQAFARQELGLNELQAWDLGYAAEKLKQSRYALSSEELKPYFPVDRVLDGLFQLTSRLYGVRFTEVKDVDVWHPDVRFFEIRDEAGKLRAQFYLDLYARAHKRGGAWMDECMSRMQTAEVDQIPVAYMTCNSNPPVGGRPALFTHDEVITLFHEFGHGLHHMLTRIDYPSVSGINGVEWDAVELPSQFMENWCWEREPLDLFARHYETGEPLPDDLYDKLRATKTFQAGMQTLRQVEFALFDMRVHLEYRDGGSGWIQQILDEVRDEVAVVRPPAFNRFQYGFSHIFAG
ncbi:MAG: M3 family metallopeptidase, partial [Gammaproteobacteria bacterium]